MQLYGEESKCHTQTCLHFWAICSVRLLTVKPMLAVSAEQEEAHVHHQRHTNQRHRRLHQLTCLRRRFDDSLQQTRISESGERHACSLAAFSCDLYTEATDSDSDSADQASADAGAATDANETRDNCEVCL